MGEMHRLARNGIVGEVLRARRHQDIPEHQLQLEDADIGGCGDPSVRSTRAGSAVGEMGLCRTLAGPRARQGVRTVIIPSFLPDDHVKHMVKESHGQTKN